MAKPWQNGWDFIDFLLILIGLLVVPGILLWQGFKQGGRWENWYLGLIILGVVLIFYRLGYMYARNRQEREFEELISELEFVFFYAKSAWSVGVGLACIFVGGFFLFPVNGSLYERYQGAFSIYVTTLGITLGIHALYRREAPITNVFYFLERAIRDLDACTNKSSKVWFVYPALNIGYYRAYELGRTGDRDVVRRFENSLKNCAGRLKSNAKAITVEQEYYRSLYEAYDQMIKGSVDDMRVSQCVENADDFVFSFVDVGSNRLPRRGLFYEFHPNQLPPQILVIDSTVYIIITYGIPIFNEVLKKYVAPQRNKRTADLIVYRRHDRALADTISQNLEELIRDKPHKIPSHHWAIGTATQTGQPEAPAVQEQPTAQPPATGGSPANEEKTE